MCIGIIWNNSFLVGGCARAEARIDPQPLRTSRSTAHGAQVVWPLDYLGRAGNGIHYLLYLYWIVLCWSFHCRGLVWIHEKMTLLSDQGPLHDGWTQLSYITIRVSQIAGSVSSHCPLLVKPGCQYFWLTPVVSYCTSSNAYAHFLVKTSQLTWLDL